MATPLSLSEVTNTYGTYRGNSLVGIRGAVGTVPNNGLEGINGVNYPFLEGIIVKINGASYTYSGYLNQLKLQGNPFISKSTIPTVSFTLDQLVEEKEETIVYEGVTRTQYSEANVNKRMSSINDILFYLNDFFNPNTSDTVLSPYSIGGWSLSTTDYSPDLDVVGEYPGLQFEATPGLAIKPSTPPTVEEPKKPEPKPIIEVTEPKPIEIIKPKPEPAQTVTSTGIKINTPAGTFTGVNQNFLLGDADRNTGLADVRSTIRQLSAFDGLDRTGLRSQYDTGDFGPLGAMFEEY
jgi:hypothetical protein